jgi:hypothetical protein
MDVHIVISKHRVPLPCKDTGAGIPRMSSRQPNSGCVSSLGYVTFLWTIAPGFARKGCPPGMEAGGIKEQYLEPQVPTTHNHEAEISGIPVSELGR